MHIEIFIDYAFKTINTLLLIQLVLNSNQARRQMKEENKNSHAGLILSIIYIFAFAGTLWSLHHEITKEEPRYEQRL